jgi:hypothetical protein
MILYFGYNFILIYNVDQKLTNTLKICLGILLEDALVEKL